MITPGTYNIICPQGATFSKTISVAVDGQPLDLTGYSAALQVRETYDSASTVVSLTNGSGITLGGVLGTINIVVASTATAAIPAGYYLYDLEITTGAGVKDRLIEGKFTVTPEITK
jgi:hypothetical protein